MIFTIDKSFILWFVFIDWLPAINHVLHGDNSTKQQPPKGQKVFSATTSLSKPCGHLAIIACIHLPLPITANSHDNYVGINASWISEHLIMQSRTLGMLLHQGRSTAECIIDRFVSDVSTNISATADVFATTSDTTGSMNLF